MFGRRSLAATVLATTLLAACGGGDEPAARPVPTSPSTDASAPADSADDSTSEVMSDAADPSVAVPAALDFTAPLLDGGEIEMGQYAGRPVLLWFWAPW